ncbi:MAG TPA: potassium channel family protein [Marmoricola sp.]|nr:potassium channel family protein [Marmoricola sp.]
MRLLTGPIAELLAHTTVTLALLTTGYYVVPFGVLGQGWSGWVRLTASVLLLVALGLLFRVHARRSRRRVALHDVQWLLTVLYLLVLLFALTYAVTQRADPQQFGGLSDRTDALYLSAMVISTVGMGDVHPIATFARLLVTAQMIFDVVYIGTAVKLLTSRRDGEPGPGR